MSHPIRSRVLLQGFIDLSRGFSNVLNSHWGRLKHTLTLIYLNHGDGKRIHMNRSTIYISLRNAPLGN